MKLIQQYVVAANVVGHTLRRIGLAERRAQWRQFHYHRHGYAPASGPCPTPEAAERAALRNLNHG
jgi:hypothetical protein